MDPNEREHFLILMMETSTVSKTLYLKKLKAVDTVQINSRFYCNDNRQTFPRQLIFSMLSDISKMDPFPI
jgi:hypothetical protein